jgi:hypothetical protein
MDTPVIIAIVVAVVIIAIIIAVVMSRSNDKETPRRRSGAAGKRTDGPRTDGPRTDGPRTDGRERTRDVPRGREDDGPRRPRNRDGRGDRDEKRR